MFHNIVIGTPLVSPIELIALNDQDWEENEKSITLFTETRYLPQLLKEAGVVSSAKEVKRNKPELDITLDNVDCLWIKWGKKFIWIIVGE